MQGKVCFLIDDDEDEQEIFSLALREVDKSVEFVTVFDGVEALQKLDEDPEFIPDYIFLDLNMPRMNGKQCLLEIKKRKHLDAVPVIVYSTSSEERDKTETKKLGASLFVTKPTRLSNLIDILKEILSSS